MLYLMVKVVDVPGYIPLHFLGLEEARSHRGSSLRLVVTRFQGRILFATVHQSVHQCRWVVRSQAVCQGQENNKGPDSSLNDCHE
jgi:L-lysine 2,3-aminomutase